MTTLVASISHAGEPLAAAGPPDGRPQLACEACRASKVRCVQPDLRVPCLRCHKSGRPCIPATPVAKRHRRAQNSLVELETKLDALTDFLRDEMEGSAHAIDFLNADDESLAFDTELRRESHHSPPVDVPLLAPSALPKPAVSIPLHPSGIDEAISAIVDDETANCIFLRYAVDMAPHLPVTSFTSGILPDDVRRSQPCLFLAALDTAAAGFCDIDSQRALRDLLVRLYTHAMLRTREYSLDLLQALVVSAAWYRPLAATASPEPLDMYQLTHSVANMAIMVGLGRRLTVRPGDRTRSRDGRSEWDPVDLAERRVWLACYLLCSNTSMSLLTPNLIRWTRYMDECVEVLDSSPEAIPLDRVLCQHARLTALIEEFESLASRSDASNSFMSSDEHVQAVHADFKARVASWNTDDLTFVWSDTLNFSRAFARLYMHELALRPRTAGFSNEPGSTIRRPGSLSPADFSDCLDAVHSMFHALTSLDMATIRALPTLFYIRMVYGAIVLVKLHFAVMRLSDGTLRAMRVRELRVDEHLHQLLSIFRGWGNLWPADKLVQILLRLRHWFKKSSGRIVDGSELAWLDTWAIEQPPEPPVVLDPTQTLSAKQLAAVAPADLAASPLRMTDWAMPGQEVMLNDGSILNQSMDWSMTPNTMGDVFFTNPAATTFDPHMPLDGMEFDMWLDCNIGMTATGHDDGMMMNPGMHFDMSLGMNLRDD